MDYKECLTRQPDEYSMKYKLDCVVCEKDLGESVSDGFAKFVVYNHFNKEHPMRFMALEVWDEFDTANEKSSD